MLQPFGDVMALIPCQSYQTSTGHRPCGLARQASKAHVCGALVMAYMCNVVWHQQLSMALLLEVVGVS